MNVWGCYTQIRLACVKPKLKILKCLQFLISKRRMNKLPDCKVCMDQNLITYRNIVLSKP